MLPCSEIDTLLTTITDALDLAEDGEAALPGQALCGRSDHSRPYRIKLHGFRFHKPLKEVFS